MCRSNSSVGKLFVFDRNTGYHISKVVDRCRGTPGGSFFNRFREFLYFTLVPYLKMLSVKQGGITYPFLSLWYDSIWD